MSDYLDYKPKYNLLNEYKYIRNKDLCINDSNLGYEIRFNNPNNLEGWNLFINLEGAGSVGPFFHSISSSSNCYLARQFNISPPFEAEFFWRFEIDMLLKPDWNL